ncbi:MAG: flippase-like domain-containing protein [Chloroflexi bacterium]|nr:flippase-like domain-containing protein [Chloroflexota bacterium]
MRQIASPATLLQPLVRAGLGIGVLVGLLLAIGLPDVWSHLERLDLRWLALAAPLYAASLLVRGVRWHLLLRPLQPRSGWLDTTAISTLGWSLNNVLPFRLGEIARLHLQSARGGVGFASLLPSALAERVLDVIVLVGIVAAGLLLLGLPVIAPVPATALAASLAVLLSLALLPFAWRLAPARWMRNIRALLPQRLRPLRTMLADYGRATQATLHGPTLVWALALTVLAWTVQGLQYTTLFLALGVEPDPRLMAMGFAIFMLTFAVNFVPGQVGTYEAFFVAVFSALQVADPEVLLAIALATHSANFLFLSLLGLASYLGLGLGHHALRTAWQIHHGSHALQVRA